MSDPERRQPAAAADSIQDSTVRSLRAEWVPTRPVAVLGGEHDTLDPVALRAESGLLLVAAGSRARRSVLLSRSHDGGASWQAPDEIACAAEGNRITVANMPPYHFGGLIARRG